MLCVACRASVSSCTGGVAPNLPHTYSRARTHPQITQRLAGDRRATVQCARMLCNRTGAGLAPAGNICTGTALSPPASAPGLGLTPCHIYTGTEPTPPHLRRDWAHPSHICAGTAIVHIAAAPETVPPGMSCAVPCRPHLLDQRCPAVVVPPAQQRRQHRPAEARLPCRRVHLRNRHLHPSHSMDLPAGVTRFRKRPADACARPFPSTHAEHATLGPRVP